MNINKLINSYSNEPKTLIKCFGDNSLGQLDVPRDVLTLPTPPDTLTAGDGHICTDGTTLQLKLVFITCWGANSHGQTSIPVFMYAKIKEYKIKFWKSMSAGVAHTCLIDNMNGNLICWGIG